MMLWKFGTVDANSKLRQYRRSSNCVHPSIDSNGESIKLITHSTQLTGYYTTVASKATNNPIRPANMPFSASAMTNPNPGSPVFSPSRRLPPSLLLQQGHAGAAPPYPYPPGLAAQTTLPLPGPGPGPGLGPAPAPAP